MADEFTPGVNIGNPVGYIADYISQGIGPTAALRDFREQGGAIGNDTWFNLYGEVNANTINASEVQSLDPFLLPNPNAYSTWALGRSEGEYISTVKVYSRDVGSTETGTTTLYYKTSTPHTPAEAIANASQDFIDNQDAAEGGYGQVFVGAAIDNMYVTTPK